MKKILMSIVSVGFVFSIAHATETVGESVSNAGKSAGASMKKGAHRVQEAFCAEGDLKCAAKKGKHRLNEGGTGLKNKATEVKDKVD